MSSRVIDPQPGWAHAATRNQQWHTRRLRGVIVMGLLGPVIGVLEVVTHPPVTPSAVLDMLGFGAVFAAPFLALAWYVDPKVRQRRYLKRFPWVEYDASVSGFSLKALSCVVAFVDDNGVTQHYKIEPNDDDYERGHRPIWFAGVPGKVAAVVSLREGACTGMAYRTQFAPTGAPVPASGRPATTATSRHDDLRQEAARRGLTVSPEPTPAPDQPAPQPPHSRVVTSGPAADHPATRQERLPAGRSWSIGFLAVVLVAVGVSDLRWPWQHGWSGVALMAAVALCLWFFFRVTGRRRTLAVLRAHPWVEYPAEVEVADGSSHGGKAVVRLTDDNGRTWFYTTYPARPGYQLGPRPVWCAGTPGASPVALSLDQGGCVSLAQGALAEQAVRAESS